MDAKELTDQFLTWAAGRYSLYTVISYQADLKQFIDWMNGIGLPGYLPGLIRQKHLSEYRDHMYDHHLFSHTSVERKLCCLRAFFKYLKKLDLVDENPVSGVRADPHDKKIPRVLGARDCILLIDHAYMEHHLWAIRDRVVLCATYCLALRPGELRALDWLNVDLEAKTISITGGAPHRRRTLKMNELIRMALVNLRDTLADFLADRRRWGHDEIAVVLNKFGGRMTTRSMARTIERYRKLAGYPFWVNLTTLRHSRMVHWLQEGRDWNEIRYMMGYQTTSNVKFYEKIRPADIS